MSPIPLWRTDAVYDFLQNDWTARMITSETMHSIWWSGETYGLEWYDWDYPWWSVWCHGLFIHQNVIGEVLEP